MQWPTHLGGGGAGQTPLAAKRQRLYRRRFGGARSVLSTGGASGIGVFGTVPSGSAGGVHLWT
jgi:hypothetical protein